MKKIVLFITLLAALLTLSAAPLSVRKGVRANPTLQLSAASCDAALKAEIINFLRASNYFDFSPDGRAEYTLEVTGNAAGARYALTRAGNTASAGVCRNETARECAKDLVDKILKDIFKVERLCRTRIAFCANVGGSAKNIILCDIDGRQAKQLTRFKYNCVEPSFFPDGKSICYTKYNASGTDVLETTLSPINTRRLTAFPGLNAGVAVDPTRRYMALVLSRDKQIELYVKEINSRRLLRVTHDKAVESSPCWSPDGRMLCYVSDKSGLPRLYVSTPGGKPRLLETVGSEAYTPDWSRSGKIAYVCRMEGKYMLAVYDVKAGKNFVVPNLSGSWESPSWAPDNRHLVCSRREGSSGRSQIYVVDTWTGRDRLLVKSSANSSMPCWAKAAD